MKHLNKEREKSVALNKMIIHIIFENISSSKLYVLKCFYFNLILYPVVGRTAASGSRCPCRPK